MLSDELLHSDICHMLIYGVGVNIATDILWDLIWCNDTFTAELPGYVFIGKRLIYRMSQGHRFQLTLVTKFIKKKHID